VRPRSGRILLAVVLPFSEFVEDGTKRRRVNGPLSMRGARCGDGASFEASLAALVTRNLEPLGLVVERASKVPYLCQGDHNKSYYALADAILLCRVAEGFEAALGGGGEGGGGRGFSAAAGATAGGAAAEEGENISLNVGNVPTLPVRRAAPSLS
jgi:hypothetical protein